MNKSISLAVFAILCLLFAATVGALPPIEGEVFGIYPITNEISLYKNVDDGGTDRGQTLQIIAINSFKIGTEFIFEFTGDFNWDLTYDCEGNIMCNDHYIELSLVKPVYKMVSLNYQRIISTFEDDPVNQFGLRFSF